MNTNQPISGVEAAALLAGLLPDLARVEMYPQWSDGTGGLPVRRQRVTLYDTADRVVGTLPAARMARRLVMRAFPGADWDRPQTFVLAGAVLSLTFPVVDAVPLWLSPAAEPVAADHDHEYRDFGPHAGRRCVSCNRPWYLDGSGEVPSAGALLEQRHQVEDPAVPPLAVTDDTAADFAASVAAGFVTPVDWGVCDPQPAPARKVADVPVQDGAL